MIRKILSKSLLVGGIIAYFQIAVLDASWKTFSPETIIKDTFSIGFSWMNSYETMSLAFGEIVLCTLCGACLLFLCKGLSQIIEFGVVEAENRFQAENAEDARRERVARFGELRRKIIAKRNHQPQKSGTFGAFVVGAVFGGLFF